MPRKTRKQKLTASIRRNKEISFSLKSGLGKSVKVSDEKIVSEEAKKETIQEAQTPYESSLASYTFHDLRRTVIISLCLFTLELAIFFANLRGIRLEYIRDMF